VIEARPPIDDDALSSYEGVAFNGSSGAADDPHILETIHRALRTVEHGGTIDIQVESKSGMRTTRIRLKRNN